MISTFAIARKEIVDNIRDKRSILSALIYGPLILPLLLLSSISFVSKENRVDADAQHIVHIHQVERVPNLRQYFFERNILVIEVGKSFRDGVRNGEIAVALSLDDAFEESFLAGKTAKINLYYLESDRESKKLKQFVENIIGEYAQQITSQRLYIRGISNNVTRPFFVWSENIGDTAVRGKELANLLPWILFMSLTMGGFYLAIDCFAGERERHSLEPLLSLSMRRSSLVFGKLIAIFVFVMLSGLLSNVAFYVLLLTLPLHELREIIFVRPEVFVACYATLIPVGLFLSSAMILIAAFSRNIKEAQTYMGISTIIPMAPYFLLTFLNVKVDTGLSWVPLISQFDMISKLLLDQPVSILHAVLSGLGSIGMTGVFCMLVVRMHNQERMLGV